MRLLDLYCGAGIGADGYAQAGFEVTGVDVAPQPSYPYDFIQADALDVLEGDWPEGFDAIDASPPCQAHTAARHMRERQGHQSRFDDFLTPTLALLRDRWAHKPWIVENVERAPGMDGALRLCGSSFGLQIQRHRLFVSNVYLMGLPCDHATFPRDPITGKPRPWGIYHIAGDDIADAYRAGKSTAPGGRTARDVVHGRELMGCARSVSWNELKEGIPPAFTRYLGEQLRAYVLVQT